ncbi:MAG: membrane protein insertase YidC, partial [Candidatus Omnitrophota bacterium]
DKWNKEENLNIDWIAFRDRYFTAIIEPNEQAKNYFVKNINDEALVVGSGVSTIVNSGATISLEYKVYAGPQKLDIMEKAGKNFTSLMVFSNWGWLDAVSKVMYWLLGILYNILHSWGLCIIAISLIVYGAMYPLTAKSLVSMKKLQALQPKMKEIQEKHKNNPERLNKEVVELYKTHQVNPLGGCLPMLLQMPIFVGLYQVLWRSVYFRGESFLWIKDLSLPDHTIKLSFTLPFLGEYVNVLPILMIGIMMIQQKLNMQSMAAATPEQATQQKIMAIVFPFLIGFVFYNMASGLNLYFVIFYLLSTLTQWKITSTSK